jgi:neopullulanase
VFNHASRGFWPFNHVLECGLDSPYVDWFHVDRGLLAAGKPLRAYPCGPFDNAADGTHDGTRSYGQLGYKAWWDLPALPKLNTDNPKVREYLMGVAEHWIRFGADGWRLDVAAEIDDDEFWREFRRRVKAANPDAYIVAEIWVEDHRWLQGDQFDAYMNYPLGFAALSFAAGTHRNQRVIDQHYNVQSEVRGENGQGFLTRVEHQLTTYNPAITAVQLNLLGSHDMPRIRTICADDLASVRLATLVTMTVQGAPCVYYGDEIGLRGDHDPGCRGSFPVDPAAWDHELLAYFSGVIALRHAEPVLRRGTFAQAGAAANAAAFVRSADGEAIVVCLNADESPADLSLWLPGLEGLSLQPITPAAWPWAPGDAVTVADGHAVVSLPARGARLLRAVKP